MCGPAFLTALGRNLLFETWNKLSRDLITTERFVPPQTDRTLNESAAETPGELSVTVLVPALGDIIKGGFPKSDLKHKC